MISAADRRYALELVDEAHAYGARLHMACRILGITERTYHRWKKMLSETGKLNDLRPCAERPTPANKRSPKEEQAILEQVSAPEFADASPKQIVPQLADRGVYIASESTFYRTLHKHSMCHHRRSGKVHTHREIPTHLASDPNQVWMWDITYLPGDIKGSYYYLYLISDLFSRFIVGWELWPEQTAEHASTLIRKTTLAWHIKSDVLVLHSDNGSPMKGSTMLATMQSLGIMPSFSRPRVSNDNAFAESLFNTLKSRPSFKKNGFESLEAARMWASEFVSWYNNEHHHSGISYLTPAHRHNGNWREIVEKRSAVYEAAKAAHPERWNGRNVRDWTAPDIVYLNPIKVDSTNPTVS